MPPDTDRAGDRMTVAATRPQRPPRTALRDLHDVLPDGSTVTGDDSTVVTGVSLSTQRILPGDLYAALPGSRVHGIDFVADALESGAVAVLTDVVGAGRVRPGSPLLAGVPVVVTEAPDLHALFARMREQKVRACAMEVSSHALVLGRVDGVVFDVAVFLNLGRDHLDFHRDVDDYLHAKAALFTPERARRGLTNRDDEHGRLLLERATIPMRTFSIERADADWRVSDGELTAVGSAFVITTPAGDRISAGCPLPGDFNVSNTLAAVAAAGEAGLDPEAVAAGIADGGGVPGRLERVDTGQDFVVVIDYAHKPDAVAAAVRTLRPLTDGQVIVVLGAGGDRDPGKRPIMAEIAARLAD